MLDSLPDRCVGGCVSRPEQLPTRFDPASFEARWYAVWEASGAFTPELPSVKAAVRDHDPPPNVTGKLHIGHALQFTLQDLVIRWRRMQGRNALWLPDGPRRDRDPGDG